MNRQKKKKLRSRTRTSRPSITSRILDIKPEDLARYARDAEQQALPIIKKIEVSPGAAIGLLAQYTHMLISGKSDVTIEGATKITDSILALWQAGSYHPSEQISIYPRRDAPRFQGRSESKGRLLKRLSTIYSFTLNSSCWYESSSRRDRPTPKKKLLWQT